MNEAPHLENRPVARPRQNNPHRYARAASQNINKPDRPSRSPQHQQRHKSHQVVDPSTNLFVNYLPSYFSDIDLRNLFSNFGQIITSKIMVNLQTGESKCYGFVRLANLQQAQNAISTLNGMQFGHKRLLVKYAESKEKNDPVSDLIYIKQIPVEILPQQIAQLFAPYGKLVEVVPHMLDNIDPNVWRCFVRFDSIESATNAIFEMNNKIILPNTKPIHVRFAEPNCIPCSNMPNNFQAMQYNLNMINFGAIQGFQGQIQQPNNPIPVPSQPIDEIDENNLLPSFLTF